MYSVDLFLRLCVDLLEGQTGIKQRREINEIQSLGHQGAVHQKVERSRVDEQRRKTTWHKERYESSY